MRIAKVGLGVAGRIRFFGDKENTTSLIGDIAGEMILAATCAVVAKFTLTVELTAFFLHSIFQ